MIPYGRQSLDDEDVRAVTEVLRSDFLTQGPEVPAFERAVEEVTGAAFAVAFSSGSAGLHGAAAAAGLGPGDVVAAPSLTFAASVECGYHVGAAVEFVDVDELTLNMDLSRLPSGATAIIAVHFAGLPLDLGRLDVRPRVVIEDAAHALGATTPLGPVGNCARSDLCVFSFHPVKAVTSGEGGIVTTNDPELAERLRRFRNSGIGASSAVEPWRYEIRDEGFNYRLSDIHAALGRSQLVKLERFVARRRQLASRYDDALAGLPLARPAGAPTGFDHGRHLYPIRVADRARVYRAMRAAGIAVQVHYVPLHHQPRYQRAGGWHLPMTDRAYEGLLSLPLYPALTDQQQDRVVEVFTSVLQRSEP